MTYCVVPGGAIWLTQSIKIALRLAHLVAPRHCGIRVPYSYQRAVRRLCDPADTKPYRMFVVRYGDCKTRALWKAAERIERKVFKDADSNSRWALWRANWPYRKHAVLVVAVDQRNKHIPFPMACGMLRLTLGSAQGLITLKAMKGAPWFEDAAVALANATLPPDFGHTPADLDITMLALLQEYRNEDYAGTHVTHAMYAQTCQWCWDHGVRRWSTILNLYAWAAIQKQTCKPFSHFSGANGTFKWGPYFGSAKSCCFYCFLEEWRARMRRQDPHLYRQIWEDGLHEWCTFESRVLQPV